MKENLYICSHRDVCENKTCGGRFPGELLRVWGVSVPEDYGGVICADVYEAIRPVLDYEIPKSEIDKLFAWE